MLTDHDPINFAKQINNGIAKGWDVWGSPSTPVTHDRILYCQSMILYENSEEKDVSNIRDAIE